MLKERAITAAIMLVLFLAALFALPDLAWLLLIVVMVAQGAAEWSRMAQLSGGLPKLYWWASVAAMTGLLWADSQLTGQSQLLLHLSVYAFAALLWLFIVPTWMIVGWKVKQPVVMMFVGWMVLIPTGLAMLDLRVESPWALLFIMALVWVADSAAYFTGRKFGKNKLAPSISPGKTWEGVAGAMVGVTVYVLMVGFFTTSFVKYAMLPGLVVAAWWWVGLAVIGDLFESAIKRQAGLKDSGALLPGHGGLLDRIDALTSTLPLAALVVLLQRLG
ncbi:MAG: phosphatidate cytidylyltransferase [Gallionella sp.]|nr:phosphatidate cytidylyltransferase [Gallionella sp.]MDD4958116.1 phosphatidate cytidylyltransferase [Gallionella sp.]